MPSLQEKVVKRPMWQGSVDDLKRVVDLCLELREQAVQTRQAELDAIRDKAIRSHEEDMTATVRLLTDLAVFEDHTKEEQFKKGLSVALKRPELRLAEYREERAADAIKNLEVRVYDERHNGSSLKAGPEVIFRTLNYGDTKNLEISFGTYLSDPRLSVDFKRHYGVIVSASGSDMTWVNGALERLSGLLKQQEPRYAFMRSSWLSYPLFMVLALVSTVWMGKWLGTAAVGAVASWGVPWIAGLLLAEFWNRVVLPRFELFGSGGRSRAKFLLGSLIAVVGLVSAVVGLFK